MPEPFLGEIRTFAGSYAPAGWAFCNGQLLSIAQNTALYSILGTMYGGNGTTQFALPNLMGRAPLHKGEGPGLTPRTVGDTVGEESATLTIDNLPMHTHQVVASTGSGSTGKPEGNVFAESPAPGPHRPPVSLYSASPTTTMNGQALSSTGGDQPHNNMQPYLGLNFIIALQGIFPSRN
jgi:microcystin-dependent protein